MDFIRMPPMAALIIALGATALAFASATSVFADQHGDVPDELVTAMDDYIATQGEESAGRCEDADIDEDIGKWCWEIERLKEDEAIVAFGPTFSEFTNRVAFVKTEFTWQIAAEELIPMPNDAPKVGTGLAQGGTANVVLIAGMVLMLAGGAAYAASQVRRPGD